MKQELDKQTVLIMGSGRSGTTWLAGILASPFRYRLLFEPFHPNHVPGAELVADKYFSPDDIPVKVCSFIHDAIIDQINSNWIAQSSNRRFGMHRWRFWPKVRIIKIIRGNLLIPAIRQLYGDKLSIVVIMRHPGAVVESMLRVKFPWAFDLSTLYSQSEFANEYNIPMDLLGSQALDPVSTITVRWLIENLYLFSQAETIGAKLVYYEDLIKDPSDRIRSLCSDLGLVVINDLEDKVNKPSYTTHPRSPIKTSSPDKQTWQERLQVAEVNKIYNILKSVDFVYPREQD